MSDLIINLTDRTLDDALNHAEQPVLLDLWAPWCSPCLAIAPLLEKVAAATGGQLTVAKLDVEEYEHLLPRFRVRGIPTLLLFRNGSEVARKVGVDSLSDLNNWLRSQGIVIESEGEVVVPEVQPWPSFYGDDELRRFLTGRLKEKALAAEISHYAFPRPKDLLTAPYVLAGQESLDVFERVSGLPPALALWLEVLDFVTPQQIDELIAVLASGKAYGDVPLHLLVQWLEDADLRWPAVLSSSLNTLRLHWIELTHHYLTGRETPRQVWLKIQQEAREHHDSCQSGQDLEQHLCSLLSILSPPSELNDTHATSTIQHHWYQIQFHLEQINAGWSRDELAMADRRWAWIEPQLAAIPEEESEGALETLHLQWRQQSPEFADYVQKEALFNEDFAAGEPQRIQVFRTRFLQLMKQAPDAA
ncbi:thioredoxin [Kosakonia radicincitans UMEnt01/12]|uniref:thioredoxin family protein n=1 Tax=Kosakonia radicincitans TaxID=283686 RepID=UPI000460D3AC|nr:thioredoxin domain-containing protein [Kosakonia radicincitans]KDE33412.1 thioredoxin [Kosakonia radicincitans UMEnt01/12]